MMTPFDGLLFFYILILALIPAALLGLLGRPVKHWAAVVNLLFLLLIFSSPRALLALGIFAAWETLLTVLFRGLWRTVKKRWTLWLAVALALVPLAAVKLSGLLGWGIGLLGISYMTFRALQVLIESYDGLIPALSLWEYGFFLLFFPSVSSGPIDRSRRFCADLACTRTREEYVRLLRGGVRRLFTGALYNFVFSKLIYTFVLEKLPDTWWGLLLYGVGYTLFLFFNFAGYSAMAVGTSHILGIAVPDNFNRPFLARDLKDFWARWHISLSTWLRDFVYTRFTMASLRQKWFKSKHTGSYLGYILTMLTMGIWHGFSWHYILYGVYHGLLMCLNDVLDTRWKAFKKMKKDKRWQPLLMALTFVLVSVGMLLFSGKLI
ncbi:MAG: D-alanyl-lipoteichoic acid biosynthesis protein DltB [Clostridia bacterium]|nr:D-alanyl-lipoteichoic acid biosynthesis protein DltB [Clostridia bacterium]